MILRDCCDEPDFKRGYIVHSETPCATQKVYRCQACGEWQHGDIIDWSRLGVYANAAVRDDVDLTQMGTIIWSES